MRRRPPPPKRYCAECGRFVARSWRAYLLCRTCRRIVANDHRGWTREGR